MEELYEHIYTNKFSFGKNWQNFIEKIVDKRIKLAEESLKQFLCISSFEGIDFLDLGCGSGLFSLAARNLGAKVVSVDIDDYSLDATTCLKNKYYSGDENWKIIKGSALDRDFLNSIGKFDIVYSWGVLHHTGDMWEALDYVKDLFKSEGYLYLAIYNKFEGLPLSSYKWKKIKKFYSSSGVIVRKLVYYLYVSYYVLGLILVRKNPVRYIKEYGKNSVRGMDFFTDAVDWLGGYPYEFASIEEIKKFYNERGYGLIKTKETKREGCNEYLFKKA